MCTKEVAANFLTKLFQLSALIFTCALMLNACGNEAFTGDGSGSGSSSTSSSDDSSVSTSSTDEETGVTVMIGSGTGSSFSQGSLGIGSSSLSAGGSTSISVTLQQDNGSLYGQQVSVSFSSSCVAQGLATITTPVSTSTGAALTTYVATGCSGTDTITASVSVNSNVLVASGSLTVAAAEVGSIQFVSATPSLISLRGTGGAGLSETSTVVFKVVDETGGPVAGANVTFSLNSTVGGLSLSPSTADTGADGKAQTVVQSGTISTAVRVTASVNDSNGSPITTQSDQLVVSTGIPDQDSFSLSASKFNVEGLQYDGESVSITARLADRFNNPVPDGTAISFTTEGGSIQSSCTTTGGACSVTWTSQNPRPCGNVFSDNQVELVPSSGPNVCNDVAPAVANANLFNVDVGEMGLGQPFGGRATIIATAVGEESFIDVNGNGIFDDGDFHTDLPEAWRDDDESETRESHEIFFDFDQDGTYDAADNAFNGVLCSRTVAPLCSSSKSLHIRQSMVLVMSGSFAYICVDDGGGCGSTIDVANGGVKSVSVTFADRHNQPMPAGTTAAVSCTIGTVTNGTHTMADSTYNGPTTFDFEFEGAEEVGGDSGNCTVTVTTLKGNITKLTIPATEAP